MRATQIIINIPVKILTMESKNLMLGFAFSLRVIHHENNSFQTKLER
jgi:hypothetical protein